MAVVLEGSSDGVAVTDASPVLAADSEESDLVGCGTSASNVVSCPLLLVVTMSATVGALEGAEVVPS